MKNKSDKIKIAIIASKECQLNNNVSTKNWFHIRKFLKAYNKVLNKNKYEIYVNFYAQQIIKEFSINYTIHLKGRSEFESIIFICSEVAKKSIQTVLMFQDPGDLRIESSSNYALLRNCDLAGANLYINWSIQLWAKTNLKNEKIKNPSGSEKVYFISHDIEKPRMARFVFNHRSFFNKFTKTNIFATSGTKKYITVFLTDLVPNNSKVLDIGIPGKSSTETHGPTGGDVVIASEIYETFQWTKKPKITIDKLPFYHIIFFIDHKNLQPHLADIQVLLKTCLDPRNKVNLITNSKTAEKWVKMYS